MPSPALEEVANSDFCQILASKQDLALILAAHILFQAIALSCLSHSHNQQLIFHKAGIILCY